MRKKIEGLRTLGEYIGTLESIIAFLEENEQHGDDYTNEKKCLRDILVDYEYTLNRANAENPTIDNVWQLQSEKKELEREVKRLRKALHIEEQIVQAFYEYREDCCFDHCEAWMLENGHRVMVKIGDDEQSEWKVEVE